MPSEAYPFGRHAVEIGSLEARLTEAGEVIIAEVISEYVDYIGLLSGGVKAEAADAADAAEEKHK